MIETSPNWRPPSPSRVLGLVAGLLLATSLIACAADDEGAVDPGPEPTGRDLALHNVKLWAYNIQDVHTDAQYDELVSTHFGLYVLETTTTDVEQSDYDMAGLISDIRRHNIDTRGVNPIVLAYVDVGQAESWRWYFDPSWVTQAGEGTRLRDAALVSPTVDHPVPAGV